LGLKNIFFFKEDLMSLDFRFHEKFDLIVCMEVLQLVKDDKKVIKNLSMSLKRGGMLFIHCPKWPPDYSHFDYAKHPPNRVRLGYTNNQIKKYLTKWDLRFLELDTPTTTLDR
jgi:SAM-dependent methyltransferase